MQPSSLYLLAFSMAQWSAGDLLASCSSNDLSVITMHDLCYNSLQPLCKGSLGIFMRAEMQAEKKIFLEQHFLIYLLPCVAHQIKLIGFLSGDHT